MRNPEAERSPAKAAVSATAAGAMVVLRSGYLIKQPIHGHFLSRPRKRYFVLTDDHLEWFQDEQARVPKDRLKVKGARVERKGSSLHLHSSHYDGSGRRAELTVTGPGDDLDRWEAALRDAVSDAVSEASIDLLSQPFPDAPPMVETGQRSSLGVGQAVSSGQELGSPEASLSPFSPGASPMASQTSTTFSALRSASPHCSLSGALLRATSPDGT